MYSRLLKSPGDSSFFLFGPRGTGKTTWIKSTFDHALYLDLLESDLFNDLLARPQRLEKMIPDHHASWIILDEVQRVPELLNEVHRLIEKHRYRFVLTGSSARKLRKRGTNLLGGRALRRAMHPLTATELGADFNLPHSMEYGQLPCACTGSDPKGYLESYVKTFLQEEVQQEAITRNLGDFSRFLEAASFSQGSVLNISSVARDCAVERKVVANYFAILEDLLVARRLPVFSRKAKRRLANHPKFYFFDAGIFRTLRPLGPLDRPEETQGQSLETLLFQELTAVNDYLDLGYQLSYWRTSTDLEVDFILYGEKGLKALEVTRTDRVSSSILSGLRAFLEDYPMARAYLLYGGERRWQEGSITVLPVTDALRELPTLLG